MLVTLRGQRVKEMRIMSSLGAPAKQESCADHYNSV